MRSSWSWLRASLLVILIILTVAVQSQQRPLQQRVGRVADWTYHHIVVSGGLTAANLRLADLEPRIWFHLIDRSPRLLTTEASSETASIPGYAPTPLVIGSVDGMTSQNDKNRKIDWSVPLGAGNVAPYMSPAKFSFNVNAQPDCVNDYVVFGLNVAGVTNGQANVVGINQLYSGTNPTGLCGTAPAVNWAYNGSTANGKVLTSPTISLDGKKIAYIESATGSAVFHILKWRTGEGTSATSSANPTSVGSCTASSSCLQSLTYSTSSTASLASPYVDYSADKGFAASDNGTIYRISCVFTCGLNSNPTVDWSYKLPVAGTGGAAPKPVAPVYDSNTGRLFVADQLGEVWVINASGPTPTLFAGPIMVGGGGCTTTDPPGRTGTPQPCTANGKSYGVSDGIIVDSSIQKIYAFSGNDGNAGASAVVIQMNEDLTGVVRDHVGLGSIGNSTTNVDLHVGDFDNKYWGTTPASGHLFLCGTGTSDTTPYQYWIGFSAYPVMNSSATQGFQRIAATVPCTPYTEFYNPNLNLGGNVNDHDLLMSGLVGSGSNGFVVTDDISSIPPVGLNFVNYPGGISAIIIDNVSPPAQAQQASSMYFTTLSSVTVGSCSSSRCAVKLSQLNLQ